MVSELPMHGPLTREDERAHRIYYIIYDYDIRRDAEHVVNWLDPRHIPRTNRDSSPEDPGSQHDLWVQTEGDEQYDYDYLADEMAGGACSICGGTGEGQQESFTVDNPDELPVYGVGIHGIHDLPSGATVVWETHPCAYCGGTGDRGAAYRNGFHRKWVAELTHEQFLVLANDRNWDLDDDERPTHYEETMGSLTEYGHLGAYCVHDHEGWTYGGEIIDAQFYISEGCLPYGAKLTTNEGT
jgi:hypothetical protein